MKYPWHLCVMAALYIVAGLFHFIKPKIYLRIMPRYLPYHIQLIYLSGFLEICLGVTLFFESTRDIAIYMIIAMLFVFLLVHFYMLSSKKAGAGISTWILILRIPLQLVLMFWAFSYLKQ